MSTFPGPTDGPTSSGHPIGGQQQVPNQTMTNPNESVTLQDPITGGSDPPPYTMTLQYPNIVPTYAESQIPMQSEFLPPHTENQPLQKSSSAKPLTFPGPPDQDTPKIGMILDENAGLIKTITEYQNSGKISEAVKLQSLLHKNLMYLTSIADST